MPEDNNLVPPAGSDGPISTTEEVLRLLRQQSALANGDDALDNPELQQLIGRLSQGLEDDVPGSGALTLEELAGIAPVEPVRENGVCADCGSRNPAGTRFCGMCGHELGKPSTADKVARDESERVAGVEGEPQASPAAPEFALMSTPQGWKIAFLALLCLTLGLAVYQQQLWRPSVWSNFVSLAAPPAPTVPKPPTPTVPKAAPAPARIVAAPGPASPEPSMPRVRPQGPTAKPWKTPPRAAQPPSKTIVKQESSASPLPRPEPREVQEHAPAISVPAAPIELPTIINPPHPSPVLEGAVDSATSPSAAFPSYAVGPKPKISGGVVPGALIFKVDPEYPASARSARLQGSVVLRAVVGTDGTVRQLHVISGNPLLVSAAMEAVKKWRYRPFLLNGSPVEGQTTVTVNFKGQ